MLYIRIRDDIRSDIVSGKFANGDKLPPVTSLAAEKGVTAATIRRALQDLTEEGLITSHVGRGTFVTGTTGQYNAAGQTRTEKQPLFRERTFSRSNDQNLAELMVMAQKPGVIAFTRGIGDLESVEKGILTKLTQKALASGEELFWDYGDSKGLLSLRKAISSLYAEQGLSIPTGQILITSGSQQALSLLAQQAAENGTSVVCETPCYAGVTNAFTAFGNRLDTVIRQEDGPNAEDLPSGENTLFYLCPILHNPMGTDISDAKRRATSAWAKKNRSLIVSDEIFRDLHPDGNSITSFYQEAGPDRSVILGSLSKSFISGLRVGWIITSEERIASLSKIKKAMDLGCPPLMQGIAASFLEEEDGFRAHRERIRSLYEKRRDATLSALERHCAKQLSWTVPQGGFQLWASLPKGYSSVSLFAKAIDNGVAFLPGPLQDIHGDFQNSFRICFGSLGEEEITEGIKRLSRAVIEYINAKTAPEEAGSAGDF